jgi:hypothetical protein
MNSTKNCFVVGRSLGLVLGLLLAGSAYAGPGRYDWRASCEQPRVTLTSVSPRPQVVPDMVTTSSLPNGRGPRQQVQVGIKHVAYGTTTVKKPMLSNGRGPLRRTEISYRYDTRSTPVVVIPRS